MKKINIDREKCIGCGLCVKDCVAGYLFLSDEKANTKTSGCISCGHCYAICPREAVTMVDHQPDGGEFVDLTEFNSVRLLQGMKSRRSIRQFREQQIEPEKVQMILEAGRYCPTGSNAQDIAYTILGSKQAKMERICVNIFRKGLGAAGKISAMARNIQVDDNYFFKGAPLVLVVSGKSSCNAALASSYMELMAESLGLGVLYSGFFVACTKLSGKLRGLLQLPKGHKVVTCMVIGYPAVRYLRIPGRNELNVKEL